MLRRSHTASIERNATFTEGFSTEPYEAAWAGEARWFIRVLSIAGEEAELSARVQISPDGLHWCDEGTTFKPMNSPGLYSVAVKEFGHWLRLECDLEGNDSTVKVFISLALKE